MNFKDFRYSEMRIDQYLKFFRYYLNMSICTSIAQISLQWSYVVLGREKTYLIRYCKLICVYFSFLSGSLFLQDIFVDQNISPGSTWRTRRIEWDNPELADLSSWNSWLLIYAYATLSGPCAEWPIWFERPSADDSERPDYLCRGHDASSWRRRSTL